MFKISILGLGLWVGLIFYNTTLYSYLGRRALEAERRAIYQQQKNIRKEDHQDTGKFFKLGGETEG